MECELSSNFCAYLLTYLCKVSVANLLVEHRRMTAMDALLCAGCATLRAMRAPGRSDSTPRCPKQKRRGMLIDVSQELQPDTELQVAKMRLFE